ncbi:MAG TPA: MmcQ/YjbR family DNA-binding protein [Candidatus Nitrosotalea sp.]|nr:MmcQ/YjbR family DNA-binding protein [Candidatus Nitrosotalea sp.]
MRWHHCAITTQEVRRIALALPEVVELEHWGNPSFRIRGRIFATMPDQQHVNVMLDPFDVEPVLRDDPGSCEELMWGKQLVGVRVSLKQASPTMVRSLLEAAWRRKAPKRLLRK